MIFVINNLKYDTDKRRWRLTQDERYQLIRLRLEVRRTDI